MTVASAPPDTIALLKFGTSQAEEFGRDMRRGQVADARGNARCWRRGLRVSSENTAPGDARSELCKRRRGGDTRRYNKELHSSVQGGSGLRAPDSFDTHCPLLPQLLLSRSQIM